MAVDIVIPAYNSHNTINRCLASIAAQTIVDNINVVIVDDASERGYADSVEIFSPLMSIKEVTMTENGGPGTARRIGMQNCNSEYIMFIDADDTLGGSFVVAEMLNAIETTESDCINSTFYEEMDDGNFYKHDNDMVWMFGKIYRRSFLDGYHIEFNDTRANEDNGFNTVVCMLSDKVNTLESIITYYWHWNDKSITRNNDYAFNGMEGFIDNQIWAYEHINKYPHVVSKRFDIIRDRFVRVFIQLYVYYVEFATTDRDIVKFMRWCKKYYDVIFSQFEPEITNEYFNDCYLSVVNDNDIMRRCVPVCTIYQFIETLRGPITLIDENGNEIDEFGNIVKSADVDNDSEDLSDATKEVVDKVLNEIDVPKLMKAAQEDNSNSNDLNDIADN